MENPVRNLGITLIAVIVVTASLAAQGGPYQRQVVDAAAARSAVGSAAWKSYAAGALRGGLIAAPGVSPTPPPPFAPATRPGWAR